jgi:hypothetical protein
MSGLSLRILGIRGVPAAHGGFETFAERLAPYLVERGWRVTVYCQEDGDGPVLRDTWQGVHRVRIPVRLGGAPGTVLFDWLSIQDAARAGEPCLTLGYNTALLCARLRVAGVVNVINMDGIEWQRAKYGPLARAWLRLNERAGAWFGQHLVADHPEIARHLSALASADRITTIPYGADPVTQASPEPVRALGLEPGRYLTLIARPEPENGILEVVRGKETAQAFVEFILKDDVVGSDGLIELLGFVTLVAASASARLGIELGSLASGTARVLGGMCHEAPDGQGLCTQVALDISNHDCVLGIVTLIVR